ncbi:hypothetical protein VN97_g1941 [Penicillium thymicola]|uniref:Uncharacterized protein n=1 Tax=Penicillium thymicola TaxID=293382 RepID=A0AAI9XBX3_PENTH|nr:hypothetical protein VN97_g1941 [Penicillium thymicola]
MRGKRQALRLGLNADIRHVGICSGNKTARRGFEFEWGNKGNGKVIGGDCLHRLYVRLRHEHILYAKRLEVKA